MNPTLLLVELGCGGHHTVYSRIMLDGGYDGYFLISSETWESLSPKTRTTHKAKVEIVPNVAWDRKKQVDLIFAFLEKHPEIKSCFIVSYAEVFFPLVARKFTNLKWITGQACIGGLWNKDNLFESRNQSWKRRLRWWALLATLTTLMTLSSRMRLLFLNADFSAVLRRFPWLQSRTQWCPEPLDVEVDHDPAIETGVHDGPPRLLFAGYHLQRKGTAWALETLAAWNQPLRVVVAGPLEKEGQLTEAISKLPPHITVTLDTRRLNAAELAGYFRAADIVSLPYRKFGGSSSIFLHALLQRKPVLVTDYGMMGRQVSELQCGRAFQPDDRNDYLRQLDLLLTAPPKLVDNTNVTEFLRQRMPAAFYQVMLSAALGQYVSHGVE